MKYKTIVIDPAWELRPLNDCMTKGKTAKTLPYHTMTNTEILNFPIDDFVDRRGCEIFVWTVQSRLQFVLGQLLDKWGFKFQHLFTWKKNGGFTVHGIHFNAEYIVYGYTGKKLIDYNGRAIPSCFSAKRTKRHSEKPAEFYDMLRSKTQEPRIDIFARKRHLGFDAYGDQVQNAVPTIEAYQG